MTSPSPWDAYEWPQLANDTETIERIFNQLTEPFPPDDTWKDLVAVGGRFALAQGVTLDAVTAHLNESIRTQMEDHYAAFFDAVANDDDERWNWNIDG